MSPPQDHHVLIVEDSQLHRRILSLTLGKLGYSVVEAKNPAEAIAHLQSSAFHAIFLDWRFHNDTGETVTTHLRDHPIETRLIITSGDLSPAMMDVYRRNGALHIIGKQFTSADIRAALSDSPGLIDPVAKSSHSSPPIPIGISSRQRAAFEHELQALRDALARKHSAEASRAAHNIHGIANLLSLIEIAKLGRLAEVAIFSGEPLEAHLTALEQAFTKLP